jgi:DNA-binding SARP family transcriptional activator
MLSFRVLGELSLSGPEGPVTGRASQRRRLALLAVLAVARGRPVTRDKLVALLWPDADSER